MSFLFSTPLSRPEAEFLFFILFFMFFEVSSHNSDNQYETYTTWITNVSNTDAIISLELTHEDLISLPEAPNLGFLEFLVFPSDHLVCPNRIYPFWDMSTKGDYMLRLNSWKIPLIRKGIGRTVEGLLLQKYPDFSLHCTGYWMLLSEAREAQEKKYWITHGSKITDITQRMLREKSPFFDIKKFPPWIF